jgi:hypothetical protein
MFITFSVIYVASVNSSLYYKHFTTVNDDSVSDAPNCAVPYMGNQHWTNRIKLFITFSAIYIALVNSNLYHKHITTVNDESVSNAPNCGIPYERN